MTEEIKLIHRWRGFWMRIGFDHKKYIEEQSKYILERVNNYDKLYLEFGGSFYLIIMQKEFYLALMKMQK